MQTKQRIFNFTDVQVLYFFGRNLETFDVSHALLPLTVAQLSTLNNSPVFLAHPVYVLVFVAGTCYKMYFHLRDSS